MALLFSFTAPPTTEIYTLSLHDALPISHAIGDTALQALPARVPPVHPVPDHHRRPAPLELGDEDGNVGRIVLQIRVERDDDAPAGRAEPRCEGGGLPRAGRERHDVNLGLFALQRLEDVERDRKSVV